MSSDSPYGIRANGGRHGDVFTAPEVVSYMLDMAGYSASRDLSAVSLLEPSCGDGSFLVEVARRIIASSKAYGFDASEAFNRRVWAYDIDKEKINRCKTQLRYMGIEGAMKQLAVADFLTIEAKPVDVVVGNPPYVRFENIPEATREYCKRVFPSFHYRADLYVAFFEKTLRLLKHGGTHCFVCANRWLKNEYGKKLRRFVAEQYRLEQIINLETANAFQEEVLAYPAITLIRNDSPLKYVNYSDCDDVCALHSAKPSRRPMPSGDDWSAIFSPLANQSGTFGIEDLGFKIGIGVATGADDIFISNTLPDIVEPELLLPAINAKSLRGDCMKWNGTYLLNPYTADGALITLDRYPKANGYLEKHRERLSRRHIARNDASKWYKTIDRIYPSLSHTSKILLPDLSGNRYVFVDEGKYYPLHNIYFITGHGVREQKILSAILMSDMVRQQVKSITNNMNGGFPRWQSQYLRKLRIPNVLDLSAALGDDIIECYESADYKGLNDMTAHLYALHPSPGPRRSRTAEQTQTRITFV